MESRQVFGFVFDPEYSEEEMARMDAHRCIEEADLCDFNNALILGFGMLLQGSKFVVAMVANANGVARIFFLGGATRYIFVTSPGADRIQWGGGGGG